MSGIKGAVNRLVSTITKIKSQDSKKAVKDVATASSVTVIEASAIKFIHTLSANVLKDTQMIFNQDTRIVKVLLPVPYEPFSFKTDTSRNESEIIRETGWKKSKHTEEEFSDLLKETMVADFNRNWDLYTNNFKVLY